MSTELVRQHDVICVEDINLRAMGECLSFGKNLHDNGFGMFRDMLAYKQDRNGSCLVKVSRNFASTKTCSCCGSVNPKVVLGVSEWDCPVCGQHHDRDFNAAVNIRVKGKEILFSYLLTLIGEQEQAAAKAEALHAARSAKKKKQVQEPAA